MKTCVCLIILGFTQLQLIFCNLYNNITGYDSYPTCPFTLIRRKRAQLDYTRWRANLEITPEQFIVKVLDEDLTTPRTKPVVAVNILPATNRQEKIIIGGAIIPPPPMTISPGEEQNVNDYTRFVAPTTVAVSRFKEDPFLAPAPLPKIVAHAPPSEPKGKYDVGRYSLRDDSPPASPQFLPRTPMLLARQYAPVTPVTFTRLTRLTSLTHTAEEMPIPSKTTITPVRTSLGYSIFYPSRTNADYEVKKFGPYVDVEVRTPNHDVLTRSTFKPEQVLLRTSVAKPVEVFKADEFYGLSMPENKLDETSETDEKNNKNGKKESEEYNLLFYNDEDSDDKKPEQETKTGSSHEILQDIESTQSTALESLYSEDFMNVSDNTTSPIDQSYVDDGEPVKETNLFANNTDVTEEEISKKEKEKRHPVCNLLKLRQLNFNSPRTLPEIVAQLKQWAEDSPVAKWVDITGGNQTTMENPIHLIIVDDPSSGQIVSAKQTVMIVAGIKGRDHHAVAAAMYVLYQLIERSEAHVDLLSKYRFWIVPVFNPDGYDYSMTFPHRRQWSKNLRQSWDICKGRDSCQACENFGLRCTIQPCYGVNLDRNFEYQWIPAEELRTEHPCGELYAGKRQLSEAETRALTNFLHEERTPLFTFIAFKEGDMLGIMYPYSHTRKKRAYDHIYRQRATRAASAAFSISGRPYVAGQTSEFLPLYAGGIEDWVDGHLGIDNTYTIMMFRHRDVSAKLITERVVHEAYAAMDTLLLQSTEPLSPPTVQLKRAKDVSSALRNTITKPMILITIIVSFFYA